MKCRYTSLVCINVSNKIVCHVVCFPAVAIQWARADFYVFWDPSWNCRDRAPTVLINFKMSMDNTDVDGASEMEISQLFQSTIVEGDFDVDDSGDMDVLANVIDSEQSDAEHREQLTALAARYKRYFDPESDVSESDSEDNGNGVKDQVAEWAIRNKITHFNYCPLVYNSMYAKNDNKIETLNKRMLRVVCNDRMSAYSVLLTRVNRPMMYYNRKKALAELVFKVLHGLLPPVPQELFIKQITMHELRDNDMLVQPRFQTMKHGFKSIAYQGTIMWNSIPSSIKAIDNYTLFVCIGQMDYEKL